MIGFLVFIVGLAGMSVITAPLIVLAGNWNWRDGESWAKALTISLGIYVGCALACVFIYLMLWAFL